MQTDPKTIAAAFSIGEIISAEAYGKGRIHATYRIESSSGTYVLQKIAALFEPAMADIERITAHLTQKNVTTTRLIRTNDGNLSFASKGEHWRLMTYIPGETIETGPTTAQAESAARFAAVFQEALLDYTEPFAYAIPNFYDTPTLLTKMLDVDTSHMGTEKYAICHPLAETIRARLDKLGGYVATPKRVLHGDLRFNNFRFDTNGVAIALIDLDTLGRYPLPIEIGNMLRSWCSSRQTSRPSLNFDTWQAAITGYRAAARFVSEDEWRAIPHGFEQVTLELAARYLTDAYEEKYFAHDSTYPSLLEQNLDRARFCLAIHDEFSYNREIVNRMFSA